MNNKNSKTLLKAKGLTKKFGDFVANNSINIEIQKGEIHALLGENGAGKSTLVKMFYGLLSSDSGDIILNGQEVNIINPKFARSLGIGMVFQHFSLFPALSVSENILISLDQKLSKHKLEIKLLKLQTNGDYQLALQKRLLNCQLVNSKELKL